MSARKKVKELTGELGSVLKKLGNRGVDAATQRSAARCHMDAAFILTARTSRSEERALLARKLVALLKAVDAVDGVLANGVAKLVDDLQRDA